MNQSQALVVRQQMSVGQAMSVEDIVAQVTLIQTVMHRVMKEGEHYGTIPGCGEKKTLLQPGAQKLTMTFRLAPEYQIQEVNLDRGHKEYRVICTLKSMTNNAFIGQGVGCCSTMESKYRYRGGARKCPVCGKEAIVMGKKFKPSDPEPGWLCWVKKGGCGEKWPKDEPIIVNQSTERVENENPADHYNTVLKMAKKRAFVDATITATAASDIFTQDIGDEESDLPQETAPAKPAKAQAPPQRPTPTQSAAPPRKFTPAPPSAPAAPKFFANEESREKMIHILQAEPGASNRDIVTEYFRKIDQLMENEELENLPLRFVPATAAQMRSLGEQLARFGSGEQAAKAFPANEEPEKPKEKPAPKKTEPAKPKFRMPRELEADEAAESEPPGGWQGAAHHEPEPAGAKAEPWYNVMVPIPRAGQKRAQYLDNPDTIGSLYEARHGKDEESAECRRRLWGFVNNYEAKGWIGKDGKKRPPSEDDIAFRGALDQFAEWFEKNHPGEKL